MLLVSAKGTSANWTKAAHVECCSEARLRVGKRRPKASRLGKVGEPQLLRPKKIEVKVNSKFVETWRKRGCGCANACIQQHFAVSDGDWLANLDKMHGAKTESDVLEWTASYLNNHRRPDREPGPGGSKYTFEVLGKAVCKRAFMAWHGLSDWKLRAAMALADNGNTRTVHGKSQLAPS